MGNIVTDDGSPSEYGGYPRNVQNRVTPSGRVVAMTTAELAQDMRREGLANATVVAKIQPGVVVKVGECNGDWCRAEVDGTAGWVSQNEIWGAYPGEAFK